MNIEYKSLTTPAAIGGTETTTATHRIHTFTSSGIFSVNKAMNVEVLVVAGGGGGGGGGPGDGGGGAGGLLYNSSYAIGIGNMSITVGNGGARNTNGYNSVFGTLIAIGGGRGGEYQANESAGIGGSGGGGSGRWTSRSGAAGTVGQGYSGGWGYVGTADGGGGGGGAGGVGADGVSNTRGGNGGIGLQYSISGSPTYYAGGGGGGTEVTNMQGAGGLGGGGRGRGGTVGVTGGMANTGGGGGGGTAATGSNAGGSGIVIISYPLSEDIPSTGSLKIISTPSGAGIWLASHGLTPSWQNIYTPDPIIGLSPGFYDIRLTRSGYEDWTFGNAEIIAGTETQISANMVLVSPANITATNMTITPSETPCRQGICTVEVSVTWTNTGGTSGTFVPNISIDGTPSSPIYLSESLGPGATVIHGFTVSGLSAGIRSICPYPN